MKMMDKKEVSLKIETPLHVGNGTTLYPMDYVVFKNRMYVINQNKLSEFLVKNNLVNDFVNTLPEMQNRFSLANFLKKNDNFDDHTITGMSVYSAECSSYVGQVKQFVRNAFGQPYIPGSSLKGLFRTAVLYCGLKKLSPTDRDALFSQALQKSFNQRKEQLKRNPNSKPRDKIKKKLFNSFENEFFTMFKLLPKNDPKLGKNNMHNDIFRVLRVGDTEGLNKESCTIKEIDIFSQNSRNQTRKVIAECLPTGLEFKINFSIDTQLLQTFQNSNNLNFPVSNRFNAVTFGEIIEWVKNPIKCVQEMNSDIVQQKETDFYLTNFGDPFPIDGNSFHLGWGGSLLTTSVSLLMSDDLRQKMRNLLFAERGNQPAPKSRKVITDQWENREPVGWVSIQ